MQKGIKFRIYPNREQQNLINKTLGQIGKKHYNRCLRLEAHIRIKKI